MREIKFRAWSTISKGKMIYMGTENISCGDLVETDNWKVQQFTGLLDDDGTELYEGDICHDISDSIYEIKFDDGKFIAIMDGNVVLDLSEVNNDIVKIGNIFENPELLN